MSSSKVTHDGSDDGDSRTDVSCHESSLDLDDDVEEEERLVKSLMRGERPANSERVSPVTSNTLPLKLNGYFHSPSTLTRSFSGR